jgi:hypothetical protein
MKHGPIFCVKRLKMLTYLVNRGFTEYEMIPDPTSNKGYNWFLFKNSDALEEAITEYLAQFKK